MTGVPLQVWLALAIAGLWLAGVLILRLSLAPARRVMAMRVMVLLGVPALGWLTLKCGPGIGVAGFLLGLLALTWPSRRSRSTDSASSVAAE